jgi:hypothetical protein
LNSGRFRCGSVEVGVSEVVQQWGFWRFPSDREYSRWPCLVAEGRRGNRREGGIGPFAAVVDGQTLLFSDGADLVGQITTFPVFHQGSDARLWSMSIVIEDHRARIIQVDRDGEHLRVRTEGRSLDGLVLAGRLNSEGNRIERFELAVQTELRHLLPMSPVGIDVGIVGPGAEIVDCRRGYLVAPSPIMPEGVQPLEFDLFTRIEKLLQNGETAQCEYKPWVEPVRSQPKLREIIKTAVAMANGEGGTILVGVTDEGAVSGVDPKILGTFMRRTATEDAEPTEGRSTSADRQLAAVRSYAWKLRDEVQKLVEPSLDLDLEVVSYDGEPVLVIHIRAGANTPYMAADTKEVHVRRNATNRRATREDLRLLHAPRVT